MRNKERWKREEKFFDSKLFRGVAFTSTFLTVLFIVTFISIISKDERNIYKHIQDVTVKVQTESGSGSGVIVTRQVGEVRKTFIWTAGHVAESVRNVDLRDGSVGFGELTIIKEWPENRCKHEARAKVIAYSKRYDLALLEVLQDNWTPLDVSAEFTHEQGIVQEIIHCGCTMGLFGSISTGIISQVNREITGVENLYIQTSCSAYPGSSGGGVFSKQGKCIGLVTVGTGPGLNFIVPYHEMYEFAIRNGIEWAIDSRVEVKHHWNMRCE